MTSLKRRVGALMAIAVVAGTGVTQPWPGSVAHGAKKPSILRVPKSSLRWSPCSDGLGFECTKLAVPLDYAEPLGSTILIGMSRVPAKNQSKKIGVILVNPGGPGASGRDFARNLAFGALPSEIRDRFDVIGWDPRGVGVTMTIKCLTDADYDRINALDPTPDDQSEIDQLVAGVKEFADGCAKNNGEKLKHAGTDDVVKDMDLMREALGVEQISYMGFSYGTYLGAKYADKFPKRVRAFLLDGVLDPTVDSDERVRRQAVGFEGELTEFFAACDRLSQCPFARVNEKASAAYDRILADIEATPVRAGRRVLGPGEAWTGILAGLYSKESGWPTLRAALASADRGSGGPLLALYDQYANRHPDGSFDNVVDANAATNCLDVPASKSIAHYKELADEFDRIAPRFGRFAAWSSIVCAFWKIPVQGSLGPLKAAGSSPILLVGTTRDPATPYVWAQSLNRQLENSTLLTFNGDGHTAYFSRNPCIREAVNSYLLALKLPPPKTVCES
jgi:pimeloyl-ACP methyl ester carboxylesterase